MIPFTIAKYMNCLREKIDKIYVRCAPKTTKHCRQKLIEWYTMLTHRKTQFIRIPVFLNWFLDSVQSQSKSTGIVYRNGQAYLKFYSKMQRTWNNQNYFEEKEQKERTLLPDFQIYNKVSEIKMVW